MTSAAQQALRRTMELFSNTTRFCLACNISTKIIEAIQSRAAILRFSKLSNEQVLDCLLRVCQAEKIAYTNDGLEALLFTAEGDMRHALNNLQASVQLASDDDDDNNKDNKDQPEQESAGDGDKKSGGSNTLLTQAAVFKVCDQPHPQIVADIVKLCAGHNYKKKKTTTTTTSGSSSDNSGGGCMDQTHQAVLTMKSLCQSGYATSDIIGTLFKVVKASIDLTEGLKLEFLREIGFTHLRICADGVTSPLQLYGLVARLSAVGSSRSNNSSIQ